MTNAEQIAKNRRQIRANQRVMLATSVIVMFDFATALLLHKMYFVIMGIVLLLITIGLGAATRNLEAATDILEELG